MSVVLNIGGDVGALILYAPAGMDGQEVEISRARAARTHAVVRRRDAGNATVYAAVYPDLAAGDYAIWRDAEHQATTATITGGSVTSCHWPS